MVSEIDVYRTARIVIKNAQIHPKEITINNMCKLYEKGDTEGAIVWARVMNAIEVLLKDNPDGVFH